MSWGSLRSHKGFTKWTAVEFQFLTFYTDFIIWVNNQFEHISKLLGWNRNALRWTLGAAMVWMRRRESPLSIPEEGPANPSVACEKDSFELKSSSVNDWNPTRQTKHDVCVHSGRADTRLWKPSFHRHHAEGVWGNGAKVFTDRAAITNLTFPFMCIVLGRRPCWVPTSRDMLSVPVLRWANYENYYKHTFFFKLRKALDKNLSINKNIKRRQNVTCFKKRVVCLVQWGKEVGVLSVFFFFFLNKGLNL